MRHHLYTKFKIDTTSLCHCGLANIMAEHVLQDRLLLADLRRRLGPTLTIFEEKLHGGTETLNHILQNCSLYDQLTLSVSKIL